MKVKKEMKRIYKNVGSETFERALINIGKLVCLSVLVVLISGFVSSRKKSETKIYEIKTSGVTYQTSAEDKRMKEPVLTETVYIVVGGAE